LTALAVVLGATSALVAPAVHAEPTLQGGEVRAVRPLPEAASSAGAAPAEARVELDKGRQLFSDERAGEALVHLGRALDLHPSPAWLRYRAQVLAELGEHCAAFDDLLFAHDLSPTGVERDRVSELLAEESALCGSGMGWAILRVRPEDRAAGARVELAGVAVPPGRTIGLSAGTHQAVALPVEGSELRLEISVETGRGATHWITIPELAAVPAPVAVPPAPSGTATAAAGQGTRADAASETAPPGPVDPGLAEPVATGDDGYLGWVLVAGGAALLAGGTWSYASFLSRRADLDDLRVDYSRGNDYLADYDSAYDAAVLRRDLGIGLWAGSAALLGFGAVLLLMDHAPSAGSASFTVEPVLGPGFSGIGLRGVMR